MGLSRYLIFRYILALESWKVVKKYVLSGSRKGPAVLKLLAVSGDRGPKLGLCVG